MAVTKLDPEICFRIKRARREAKLSQSVLASEVGCKQSALSMFEQGDGTKLNDAVVEKLAKKFNIDLRQEQERKGAADSQPQSGKELVRQPIVSVIGFCPNPHCPSNRAYVVDGRTFVRPERREADPVGGKFCALCGEVFEKGCPNCGLPVHDGAVCSHCGAPYVAIADG